MSMRQFAFEYDYKQNMGNAYDYWHKVNRIKSIQARPGLFKKQITKEIVQRQNPIPTKNTN